MAIRTFAHTDDEADDFLQDCWVQILERLDRYEPRGTFAGWAIVVSRNVCKMKLREERQAGLADPLFLEEYRINTEYRTPDGQEPEQPHWERFVHEALARLPDRERDVIVMRLFEGRTAAETAEILKISEDAAQDILQRAMTRLKRMEELQELLPKWKGWD